MNARLEWGEPHTHIEERSAQTKQGHVIDWTVPGCKVPLLCNGVEVGYAEIHMHPAWAPDGVPDMSFGFTGRINTEELRRSLNAT